MFINRLKDQYLIYLFEVNSLGAIQKKANKTKKLVFIRIKDRNEIRNFYCEKISIQTKNVVFQR